MKAYIFTTTVVVDDEAEREILEKQDAVPGTNLSDWLAAEMDSSLEYIGAVDGLRTITTISAVVEVDGDQQYVLRDKE